MQPEREETPARAHFSLALAGVLVPFVGFFLSGGLAAWALLRPHPDPAHTTWTKRLFALAVVDFFVLLAITMLTTGKAEWADTKSAAPPGPRIGVYLDRSEAGAGALVGGVKPGSPADRAGLHEGDVITAIDGRPVANDAELLEIIGATPPGKARALTIRRGPSQTLELPVVPERLTEPRGPSPPLFQRGNRPSRVGPMIGAIALTWGVVAGLAAALAIVAFRRGAPRPPSPLGFWLWFAGLLALSNLALVAASLALSRILGGPSLGVALIGVNAGSATLLAGAALWKARLDRFGALAIDSGHDSTLSAVVRGIGYMFAGALRVGILLSALTALLKRSPVDPGGEIRDLLGASPGPAGIALLAFGAVILAPIGEEILFRGVLLPWLARWMKPSTALWVSAILFGVAHFRYGIYLLVLVAYGLALGWARLRTGNLRASILLHMMINSLALIMALRQG